MIKLTIICEEPKDGPFRLEVITEPETLPDPSVTPAEALVGDMLAGAVNLVMKKCGSIKISGRGIN